MTGSSPPTVTSNAPVSVDLAHVRALLAAATPGPWHTGSTDPCVRREVRDSAKESIAFCGSFPAAMALANAALIAAASTLLRDLAGELEATRADLAWQEEHHVGAAP